MRPSRKICTREWRRWHCWPRNAHPVPCNAATRVLLMGSCANKTWLTERTGEVNGNSKLPGSPSQLWQTQTLGIYRRSAGGRSASFPRDVPSSTKHTSTPRVHRGKCLLHFWGCSKSCLCSLPPTPSGGYFQLTHPSASSPLCSAGFCQRAEAASPFICSAAAQRSLQGTRAFTS